MLIDPPITLPTWTIVLLNICGWPLIQIGIAKLFLSLPEFLFAKNHKWLQEQKWEHKGRLYERVFFIRSWKGMLPDGARWLGHSFAKKIPPYRASRDSVFLQAFLVETRRGEAAHWTMLLFTPLFFFWNPLWADAIMLAYALASNLPCILVQRYLRIRLTATKEALPIRKSV